MEKKSPSTPFGICWEWMSSYGLVPCAMVPIFYDNHSHAETLVLNAIVKVFFLIASPVFSRVTTVSAIIFKNTKNIFTCWNDNLWPWFWLYLYFAVKYRVNVDTRRSGVSIRGDKCCTRCRQYANLVLFLDVRHEDDVRLGAWCSTGAQIGLNRVHTARGVCLVVCRQNMSVGKVRKVAAGWSVNL